MKTIEQKFKQLLNIARDNDFDTSESCPTFLYSLLNSNFTINELKVQGVVKNHYTGTWQTVIYSLNDLVLETNFFDCLFKNFEIYSFYRYIVNDPFHLDLALKLNKIDTFKIQWVLEVKKGTALQWLFKQFNL